MSPSKILLLLWAGASLAYADYFGGIAGAPLLNSEDSAFCPQGYHGGDRTVWCCPAETEFDDAQDDGAICCPSEADCTEPLINSGIQCADPSLTLFESGQGGMLCCPSGYYVNELRYCVTSGDAGMWRSRAQANSLTPTGAYVSAAASGGSAAVTAASNSATPTPAAGSAAISLVGSAAFTAAATIPTAEVGSGTVGTAGDATGTIGTAVDVNTVGQGQGIAGMTSSTAVGFGGIRSSTTSTSVKSTSTGHSGGRKLAGGEAGMLGAALAIGAMALV